MTVNLFNKSGPVVTTQIISIVSTDDYAGVYMILCLRKGMNMDVVQLFVAGERGLGDGYHFV